MSEENVEVVRRIAEAFKRDGVEAMLPLIGEDVVCEESPRWPDRKTYHGHDGVRQAWEKVCDAFDDASLEPEDYIDAGDHVVVFIRVAGRIPKSEVRIDARIAYLYTLRKGKVVRIQIYDDREDALEAAGQSEQDAHADS